MMVQSKILCSRIDFGGKLDDQLEEVASERIRIGIGTFTGQVLVSQNYLLC